MSEGRGVHISGVERVEQVRGGYLCAWFSLMARLLTYAQPVGWPSVIVVRMSGEMRAQRGHK